MAFFEFPHTRTYDGDLSYILHLLKEIFDNFADTRKDVHFKKSVEIDENLIVHGNTTLGDDENDVTTVTGIFNMNGDLTVNKNLTVNGESHLHNTDITGDLKLNNLSANKVLIINSNQKVSTSIVTPAELGVLTGIDTSETLEERLSHLRVYTAGESIEITEDNILNFIPLSYNEIDTLIEEVFN